jgi:uncharacterized membrane protein
VSRLRGPRRWLRHLWIGAWHVRRVLPPDAMRRIELAIAEGERQHRAEIRFAVESSLGPGGLWRGTPAQARAVEVFSAFRIWDTEEDNGVLIYLLWADRAVEIVADRGAMRRVDPAVWPAACEQIVAACRRGEPEDGVLEALRLLAQALAAAFPADGQPNPDELPNRPLRLG